MTSSPVFVWCRSSEGCPCLLCPCLTSGYQRRLRARGGAFAFAPTEGELGRFAMIRGEEPTQTYNRLKTLVNKIRSYGSTRWMDHDVVRLMLRSFTVIDPHLVNLIRENLRYTQMTPEEILRKFVSGRMMVKEARYVDDALNDKLPVYEP
jgi:hypothetical protein